MNPYKKFVGGMDWRNWRVGFHFHDIEGMGIIIEINVLPLTMYYRI